MARLGTPFLTPKIPPKKFMWGPVFASFPRKSGTQAFFSAPKMGCWVGAKKFVLKKFMCFFGPLSLFSRIWRA